jgi:predicted ABC-type ATPase
VKRGPGRAGRVMDIVAGPPGSGKSTFFPVAERGVAAFNVDERRRELNQGDAHTIPAEVKRRAIADYEAFIEGHIQAGESFAFEATLAKEVTFEQAERARKHGFRVQLTYVAADADVCVERVANRFDLGGHGAPPAQLRQVHARSMGNLSRSIRSFATVLVYDNSVRAELKETLFQAAPRLVLEAHQGKVVYLAEVPPSWLREALATTEYAIP